MERVKNVPKIDDAFLAYASDILADTNDGLSGMKIVEYCNSYAIDYNRKTPYGSYPFDAPNKRTALKENLRAFEDAEQFHIIKDLCELPMFSDNDKVSELKLKLFQRYGTCSKDKALAGKLPKCVKAI